MRSVAETVPVLSSSSRRGPAAGAETSNAATHAWLATTTCCCSAAMVTPLESVAGGPMPSSALCCTCNTMCILTAGKLNFKE